MGIVFKAEDLRLGRCVALKFLPPEVGQEEKRIKRFVQEAKAASFLDHPNLCTIYEIDQTQDGQMFIAMALYEGQTLREKISDGSIHLENAIDYAIQIANGLAIAHENGIVHRDIKPANIIVTRSGLVKILDFGLAKLTGASQITEAETTVGTIAYMSPEQALGKTVDQRTDIWSWGVVLYEMLTGNLPYRADNPLQLVHMFLSKEPIDLTHRLVPAEVVSILQRSIQRDPEERYRTMVEASSELRKRLKSPAPSSSSSAGLSQAAAPTVSEIGVTITAQKAEKKPLTFLVSGITGYTDLLEQLAFDEASRFLSRLQKATEALAERYRAVLNEFDPDRIVILFGIPAAQENDFVTAVQFAFDLQAAIKEIAREFGAACEELISIRAGIHSGLVLMQPSLKVQSKFDISGLPLQIAISLASNARPSEVVITQESRRLTRNLFVTESRDPVLIPSISKSSNALSLLSHSDTTGTTFLAKYTGREKEMGLLQQSWDKVRAGEGQLVTIIGEAGVGKSRLFAEFKRTIDEDIRFLYSHCHPYAAPVPYAPFRELLVNALEIHSYSSPEEVIEKILNIDPLLQDFIPLYLHLLSLQSGRFPFPKHLEGENLRLAILDALSAFVLVNTKKPVLLFLEDWHWSDEASQITLKQVIEMTSDQKVLVVVTYRPDASLDWAGMLQFSQIYVDPLEISKCREVMKSLLECQEVSEPLAQLVFDRSGGNPFFVEEICFSLQEQGKIKVEGETATLVGPPGQLRLPETIQALILSRLDRLTRSTREVLQNAAVIGREFTRSILQSLSQKQMNLAASLTSLKSLGLIQQVQVLPEATYKFRHALTQEVAYDSLIARDKKEIHHRVAEAIEEVYKDRLEEHYDILAAHFGRAENWQKAVHYGSRSSKKAASLGRFSDALQILKKAEDWCHKMPADETRRATEIDLLLQEERLCETLGIRTRQEQILQELLAALEQTQDQRRLMEVYRRQGELLTLLARFDAAETALLQSLSLSKTLQDRSEERNALRSIGFMRWHQGRNEEAIQNNEAALTIDRQQGDIEATAADLANLGSVLRNKGDYAAAIQYLEEALEMYQKINDPVKHAAAFHMLGNVHRELGNEDEAMHYMQSAMAVSTRYRLVIMQSFHLTSLANMCWQQGKAEECLDLLKRAVEINRKSRYADGLANSLRLTGETLRNMNRNAEAIPFLEEAVSLFARLKDTRNEAALWGKLADIHEERGSSNEAVAALERFQAVQSAEKPKEIVPIYERMAKISRNAGKTQDAIRFYRRAIQVLRLADDQANVGAFLNSVAILEWRNRMFAEALEDYKTALAIFQDLGDEVHAGLMLNSIGLTLKSMERYDEALSVLQQAVAVNRSTGQRKLEGHALATLADVYSETGQFEDSLQHYAEALQIKRETSDPRGEAWMLYHLARLQNQIGYDEGVQDYKIEAEQKVLDHGDDRLKDAWKDFQRKLNPTKGGDRA